MSIHKQPGLHVPTRIVLGENTVDELGTLAREYGGTRVLVVSDEGVAAAGHLERAHAALSSAGLVVSCYEHVAENPTTEDVHACKTAAEEAGADLLVGLGGGSPIDAARGANFLLSNGGRMEDYWGASKATQPMLPMIAVPTTTGTGSEMQSFALIADADTHQKMACGDKKAAARVAILDPTLSATQPWPVMARTGLDCIAHALESAVCTVRTSCSQLFSRESWRLAAGNLDRILGTADDLEAQGNMLLASAYAGIAIENSMLGAAHSLANPLTATYDLAHGRAVGIMLPAVMRYNAGDGPAKQEYAVLARLSEPGLASASDDVACAALIDRIERIVHMVEAGSPGFAPAELNDEAFRSLAEGAAGQWTVQFNPRPVTRIDLERLYREALANEGTPVRPGG